MGLSDDWRYCASSYTSLSNHRWLLLAFPAVFPETKKNRNIIENLKMFVEQFYVSKLFRKPLKQIHFVCHCFNFFWKNYCKYWFFDLLQYFGLGSCTVFVQVPDTFSNVSKVIKWHSDKAVFNSDHCTPRSTHRGDPVDRSDDV